MIAIWASIVMTVTALALAMTLTWRKSTAPEAQACRVEAGGCYPKVRR